MLNVTINHTQLRCKPENIAAYQLKISKPPKGGTRFRELFGTPLAGPTVRDVYARQLIVPAAR